MVNFCPWCGGRLAGKPGQYVKCSHCTSSIVWSAGKPFRSEEQAREHLTEVLARQEQETRTGNAGEIGDDARQSYGKDEVATASPQDIIGSVPTSRDGEGCTKNVRASSARGLFRSLGLFAQAASDVIQIILLVGVFGKRKIAHKRFSRRRIGLQIYLRGSVFHDTGLKTLSRAEAQFLTARAATVRMDRLEELTAGTADELAAFEGQLMLPGLRSLHHVGVAKKLSAGGLGTLPLDADMSVEVGEALYGQILEKPSLAQQLPSINACLAWVLVENIAELNLSGLRAVTVEAALVLASHCGSPLHLNGLVELPADVATALAGYRGSLRLNAVRDLDVEAAKALAVHRGSLYLKGLQHVSPEVARALSSHRGNLHLSGVRSVSEEVADAFSSHGGGLDLSGVAQLDEKTAERFARKKGKLRLAGLQFVSEPVAASLAKAQEHVMLTGLRVAEPAVLDLLKQNSAIVLPDREGDIQGVDFSGVLA